MRAMRNFVALPFLLLLVCLLLFAGGSLALGLGWGLSKVFPVTVFQGSLVIVAVTTMLVFYIALVRVQDALRDIRDALAPPEWEWSEDGEDEDEGEEWDEETNENGDGFDRERNISFTDSVKTRRDDPCPCGSGRKYKNCCGRGEIN